MTSEEPVVIGRLSDQMQLSDNASSREHAEIFPQNGAWLIKDLQSSNGTFINGQRINSPKTLKHGDQIKIGTTLIVFGGDDQIQSVHGARAIRDLVQLDVTNPLGGSSILAAVNAAEESVILQTPETADAVTAWHVVQKVAEMVGSVESDGVFLQRVADTIFEYMVVDRLVIFLKDNQSNELEPAIVQFRSKDRSQKPKIIASQKIVKHVADGREGVLCANAMTDDRFLGDAKTDSIHRLGLRSVICVPIVAHDALHGVIHIDCSMSHHTYTQEQLQLMVSIGRLAAMAVENAKLLESRVKTERLAATGETVAYLSHEIRNILQGMQGGADVIDLALANDNLEAATSGWSLVSRNLDRILRLSMNMLSFGKIRQPRVESAQLNSIVKDVVQLVQHQADDKSVMLLTDLEEMPAIPIDIEGVHQAVHNILINAIQASPKNSGRVNIHTSYHEDKSEATITIADNGPGITTPQLGKIFDPFHSTKGQSGTGLGLAAARKIIGELGGRIEVENAPGQGATFHIHLSGHHIALADSDQTHGPPTE